MLVRPSFALTRARNTARLNIRTFSIATTVMHQRDYADAIHKLNTLQSNFAIVDEIRKSGRSLNKDAIPEMVEWLNRLGYEPRDLDKLNIIHIAGTKGKGSTSAFISSILCQDSLPTRKVGLFISPHLRSVRERIQINNEPLSEEVFAKYFFEVWDKFEEWAKADNSTAVPSKPVYFRFLTLMAFHAYLKEQVDTAIIECGIGGEYDSTNIIQCPTVCGVTNLDIDHVAMLGNTIEEIAWHKAGIFKQESRSTSVFTVDNQPKSALDVLRRRAAEKERQLKIVPLHPEIRDGTAKLGLAAPFQKTNASLAVAITYAHLRALGYEDFPEPLSDVSLRSPIRQGLERVVWAGRCEIRKEQNIEWCIDGGHTPESIRLAAEWFASTTLTDNQSSSEKPKKRILIFNQQTRDAVSLAETLHQTLSKAILAPLAAKDVDEQKRPLFTHAIFCTNVTFSSETPGSTQQPKNSATNSSKQSGHYKADLVSINTSSDDISTLTVQRKLAAAWESVEPSSIVAVQPTIQSAIESVRALAKEETRRKIVVFVTGSLHLVGGVLEVLETT